MALPPGIGLRRCPMRRRTRGQCGRECRGARRSIVGLLAEAVHHDALEIAWNRQLGARRRRVRRGLHVLEREAHRIGIVEHERARQQEIGDAAERVHVGAAVNRRFAHGHFGRDVSRRARGRAFHRQLCRQVVTGNELGETEVENLDEVVVQADLADHRVRRLQIAVDQALTVGFLERFRDRHQNRQNASRRLRAERRHQRLETDAVEQLHHVIEPPITRHAEIVEVDRVRRLQTRDDVGFALEAFRRQVGLPRAASRGLHANQLDRGGARQHLMAGLPHFAHAAFTDRRDQPVASELHCGLSRDRDPVHPSSDHVGQDREEVVEERPRRELSEVTGREVVESGVDEVCDRPGGGGGKRSDKRPRRAVWNEHTDRDDPRRDRRNADRRVSRIRWDRGLNHGSAERHHDFPHHSDHEEHTGQHDPIPAQGEHADGHEL